jgi:hypothetical protein
MIMQILLTTCMSLLPLMASETNWRNTNMFGGPPILSTEKMIVYNLYNETGYTIQFKEHFDENFLKAVTIRIKNKRDIPPLHVQNIRNMEIKVYTREIELGKKILYYKRVPLRNK